VVLVA